MANKVWYNDSIANKDSYRSERKVYQAVDIRVQKNVLKEMHCENMWHAIIQIINIE